MVSEDRIAIHQIIDEMLCNPGAYHTYNTTKAYDKLEELLHQVRMETAGWTLADVYIDIDNGKNIRTKEVPDMVARMENSLLISEEE